MTHAPLPALLFALTLAAGLAGPAIAHADDGSISDAELAAYLREGSASVDFLVVGTFQTYGAARRASAALAKRAGVELPDQPVELHGGELTYPRSVCDDNGWDYPCYVARGRYDDGVYLSVEPSGGYDGLRRGLFLVIAASGEHVSVRAVAQKLKARHIPSYTLTRSVWMGCIH